MFVGVYDQAPPAGSGLSEIEIPESDLFWFDKGMVRGAARFTEYRDQLRDWFSELIP